MTKKQFFALIPFIAVEIVLCLLSSLAQDRAAKPFSFDNEPETAFARSEEMFLHHQKEGIEGLLNDEVFRLSDGNFPANMVIDFEFFQKPDRIGGSNENKVILDSIAYRNCINDNIKSSITYIELNFFRDGTLERYAEHKGYPPAVYKFSVRYFADGNRARFINWNPIEKYVRIINWNPDGEVLSDVTEN